MRGLLICLIMILAVGCGSSERTLSSLSNIENDSNPQTPPPPSSSAAYSFSFPEEFTSRPSIGQTEREYVMSISQSERFRRIVARAQIFHGGWHSYVDPYGQNHHMHALFWFTRGGAWGEHVIGYSTAKTANKKLKLGTNISRPGPATPGTDKSYSNFLQPNQWYQVEFIYDASGRKLSLKLTNATGTEFVVMCPTTSPLTYISNNFGTYNFFFGSSASAGTPEAATEGWKIRNLTVEFFR